MPGTETFTDFLKRRKEEFNKEPSVDWDKEKEDWIASVDALYKKIERWLKQAQDEDLLKIQYEDEELSEERLGSYKIRSMHIDSEFIRVKIRPVARIVIGGKGRLDMICGSKKMMIVRSDDKWKFAIRTPKFESWPLNKKSFTEILQEMME